MRTNSYVCKSCRGKTDKGPFCPHALPSWIGLKSSLCDYTDAYILVKEIYNSGAERAGDDNTGLAAKHVDERGN